MAHPRKTRKRTQRRPTRAKRNHSIVFLAFFSGIFMTSALWLASSPIKRYFSYTVFTTLSSHHHHNTPINFDLTQLQTTRPTSNVTHNPAINPSASLSSIPASHIMRAPVHALAASHSTAPINTLSAARRNMPATQNSPLNSPPMTNSYSVYLATYPEFHRADNERAYLILNGYNATVTRSTLLHSYLLAAGPYTSWQAAVHAQAELKAQYTQSHIIKN